MPDCEDSSGSKRISLSSGSENHHQGGSAESSSQSSPLGLTLSKTPSFLNLVQMSLNIGKHSVSGKDMPRRRVEEYVSPEKLKASNFPAMFLQIGTWELNQPPTFFREINPQPRKHTLWQQSPDFTGGQAPNWRIHSLRFPPGMLDKHYEKLLQFDARMCTLAKMPFPSRASPFFNPEMFVPFSLDFNSYPYPPLPTMDAGTPSWAGYHPNGGMIDFGVATAPSNNTNYQQAYGMGLGCTASIQCSPDGGSTILLITLCLPFPVKLPPRPTFTCRHGSDSNSCVE
ncbi:hypothetical protein SASPL_133886 [Salvia splendens]|uniref:TRF2/HOY1 PH-like domain-containing protein n=1 Tax=Salvia splendens TaxID=180675 RepID=A0A8X8ZIS8_SALSN|nr:hypothetical protein SASPL_133886 [Salvia splendens]